MSKSAKNLLNTLINVEPTLAAWRLSTRDIEDFIYNYFVEAGIDGVKRPVVIIEKEGTNSNIGVSAFAFFSTRSADVIDNGSDIENEVMRKFVAATRYKPTRKLRELLAHVACYDRQKGDYDTTLTEADRQAHVLLIKLDVIRILSAMLCAPRSQYQLVIMQAVNTGRNEGQLLVAKQVNYGGSGNNEDDIYRELARNVGRKDRRR